MSDAPNTPKKNNNSRRRNYKKKKPANKQNNAQSAQGPSNKVNSEQRPNNKRRNSQSKNRRPKSLTPSRILQKYDNLMEQYLTGRKKYFDMHGRANPKQFEKIEKNYRTALANLRKFETDLKEDWQKEILKSKIDGLPADRQYTTDHNIEPVGDEVSFVGEFEDPHLLVTQKEHQWTEDTEESSGSIEDYNTYKGIVPSTT